ncbi:MAG: hypothetical protein L6247_04260, partial [Desulfobacteraceae bacterium]|nr:hypothetical protein [Desulfobacteraceae bacterium]
ILITSFLEELVENSKVIVSQVAEIINPGRVESRKVIVKVVSNEFALSEQIIVLGQHITAIDDYICFKVFCCFEYPFIFPLASMQVRYK